MSSLDDLRKYAMSYAFDASRHPRDQAGRFSVGSSVPAQPERRSLTRVQSWQRIGARTATLPQEYTGKTTPETPVDSWKELSVSMRRPKAIPPQEHASLLARLKQIVAQHRQPAIEKAMETRSNVAVHGIKDFFTKKARTGDLILDPATPKGAVNRAYNHAAMLALHDFGVVDYGPFKMSDAQKTELTPLVPFMRYVRRRLNSNMRGGDLSVARRLHVGEFGQPFPNPKKNADGSERLRVRPNQEFVKLAPSASVIAAAAAAAHRNPTEAQKEAGNYRMGHTRIGGLGLTLENAKGSIRRKGGKRGWKVKMPAHYGYVKGSEGLDGDHVDVYLGPQAHLAHLLPVHVVNQVFAGTDKLDEHKAMIGFRSRKEAIKTYDAGFSDGKGPQRRRSVDTMPWGAFRAWVKSKEPRMSKLADLHKAATAAQQDKVHETLHEFKHGKLRSWRGLNARGKPRKGPKVTNRKQAIAIALSQAGLSKRAPAGCADMRVYQALGHANYVLHQVGAKAARGTAHPLVAAVMQRDVRPTMGDVRSERPEKIMDRNELVRDPRRSIANLHRAA